MTWINWLEFTRSSSTTWSISTTFSADCFARLAICSATTANPFPASPALAASIEAFNASKSVWSAISLIRFAASLIFCADSFVFAAWSYISRICVLVTSLIPTSSSNVFVDVSFNVCISCALLSKCSTSFSVCTMPLPMASTSSVAALVYSACEVTFCVISSTAVDTSLIDTDIRVKASLKLSSAVLISSDTPEILATSSLILPCAVFKETAVWPISFMVFTEASCVISPSAILAAICWICFNGFTIIFSLSI